MLSLERNVLFLSFLCMLLADGINDLPLFAAANEIEVRTKFFSEGNSTTDIIEGHIFYECRGEQGSQKL